MSGGADAQRRFEMENNVQTVDADSIYNFDPEAQKKLREQKPWTKEWGCPLTLLPPSLSLPLLVVFSLLPFPSQHASALLLPFLHAFP
jgi:hypothetical protein